MDGCTRQEEYLPKEVPGDVHAARSLACALSRSCAAGMRNAGCSPTPKKKQPHTTITSSTLRTPALKRNHLRFPCLLSLHVRNRRRPSPATAKQSRNAQTRRCHDQAMQRQRTCVRPFSQANNNKAVSREPTLARCARRLFTYLPVGIDGRRQGALNVSLRPLRPRPPLFRRRQLLPAVTADDSSGRVKRQAQRHG